MSVINHGVWIDTYNYQKLIELDSMSISKEKHTLKEKEGKNPQKTYQRKLGKK